MNRQASSLVLALLLVGCGDDDEGDGGGASETTCALGVTLSGDVQDSMSTSDDATCIISYSYDSGIDAGFAALGSSFSVQVGIAAVMEAETGTAFPTEMGVTLDDGPRYSTSPTGCSASITEHELESTETTSLGEVRNYRVVGTVACSEAAIRGDGTPGQITLENIAFRIPAIWSD